MTTQEAADKLGFNVRTIPGMMKDKELDGVRFGRAWFVSRKSVDFQVLYSGVVRIA